MTSEKGAETFASLEQGWDDLTERERRIIQHSLDRAASKRDVHRRLQNDRTLGDRVADRLSSFGGSWTFIILFLVVLIAWIITNGFILARMAIVFDPFPFILLNLFLSMLAAIQAPVILMSQNRQGVKDRMQATHDYEVDLKAELEIVSLHQKIDDLLAVKWENLVAMQQEQIKILNRLLQTATSSAPNARSEPDNDAI